MLAKYVSTGCCYSWLLRNRLYNTYSHRFDLLMNLKAMAAPITEKTVVVTGGSKGIGLNLVRNFLARNNRVVATSRKPSESPQLQQLQQQYGAQLSITELDTSVSDSISSWAAKLVQEHKHIDVLVNNAGVYGRRLEFSELTEEDFLFAFRVNTLGPFLVSQQLYKAGLLGPPHSLVVNVSSIVSSHGDTTVSSTTGKGYAYRASKAALNIINKAMTIDLAEDKIECVLIHPGYVKTELSGGLGWIEADESAAGIMNVLESGMPLNNKFYAYDGKEIPW